MSLSSTTQRNDYSLVQAVFAYVFRIFSNTDLRVVVRDTSSPPIETLLTLTTDYTVSGVGNGAGGNVTLVSSGQAWIDGSGYLKSGYTISIERVRPLTQTADIRNQGVFFPETHEDVLDHVIMVAQQLNEAIGRCVRFPETVTGKNPQLPGDLFQSGNANKSVVLNNTGDGFATGPSVATIQAAAANAATQLASAETDVTLANNQSAAASISGLVFDKTVVRSAVIEYDIRRRTDTASSEVRCVGVIKLIYNTQANTWTLYGPDEDGDSTGITFSVTSGGQVQYTSTNITGTNYVGKLAYRARSINV